MLALRPLALILLFGTGLWAVGGQDAASPDPLVDRIEFRNLGPFRAGAWITYIAVPERPGRAHRTTIYVATRNGGLWKTTNAGTTFEPLLDAQGVWRFACSGVRQAFRLLQRRHADTALFHASRPPRDSGVT